MNRLKFPCVLYEFVIFWFLGIDNILPHVNVLDKWETGDHFESLFHQKLCRNWMEQSFSQHFWRLLPSVMCNWAGAVIQKLLAQCWKSKVWPTDGPMDGPTDGQTEWLIESRSPRLKIGSEPLCIAKTNSFLYRDLLSLILQILLLSLAFIYR